MVGKYIIDGTAGVLAVGDNGGHVVVEHDDEGSTLVPVTVVDSNGTSATVFLDWRQGAELMTALGAALRNK